MLAQTFEQFPTSFGTDVPESDEPVFDTSARISVDQARYLWHVIRKAPRLASRLDQAIPEASATVISIDQYIQPKSDDIVKLAPVKADELLRDRALGELAEIELFVRGWENKAARAKALYACRSAVAFVSFWPNELGEIEADLVEDGTVSIEQYRIDGTLQSLFDFRAENSASYAILEGSEIVAKDSMDTSDRRSINKALEAVRSVLDL